MVVVVHTSSPPLYVQQANDTILTQKIGKLCRILEFARPC